MKCKIEFIKDTEKFKKGEIAEASKKSAESYVKNGYAEYIKEPKKKTKSKKIVKKKNKEIEISIDKKEYDRLVKKYKSVIGTIDKFIENKCKYFAKKPFEEKIKNVWCTNIADHIEFTNPNGKEEIIDPETLKKELKEIYKKIIIIIKRFCDLKEEQYPLVALWIIGTYIYEEFETYPYLFFNAMKGSGKTRILKLIASLSNKGELIGSLSESVLFRTAKGRTMCIDEFERVGSKEKQSLRELLNVAYKKGQIIKRMKKQKTIDGEDFVVEEFEVYTPIAMANIWGMEEVLEDRCISLVLEKSNNPAIVKLIEDFARNEEVKNITTLLSKGSCSLCSLFHKKRYEYNWNNYIIKKYPPLYSTNKTTHTTHTTITTNTTLTTQDIDISFFKKLDKTNIQGRHLELSFPLFALSRFLGVFDETLKTIKKIMEEKKLEDMTESKDVQVYDFVSTRNEGGGNFLLISNLTKEFRSFLNIEEKEEAWVNSRWFGRALKRLVLVKEKRRKSKGIEVILNIDKAKEKIKMFKEPEEKQEELKKDEEIHPTYKKIDYNPISIGNKGSGEIR